MLFVNCVRENNRWLPFGEAVEKAVQTCIRENILAEFLGKNRAEVVKVSIFEYDAEKHLRLECEAAREDGMAEGISEGIAEGREALLIELVKKKLRKGLGIEAIAEIVEADSAAIEVLCG